MIRLRRPLPVRVTVYLVTVVLVVVGQLLPTPLAIEVVLALVGLAGVVVAGDAYRPSGRVVAPVASADQLTARDRRELAEIDHEIEELAHVEPLDEPPVDEGDCDDRAVPTRLMRR